MKLIVCKYQYILFTSFILLSLNDWLIRCDLFHIQHIKQDNTNKQNSVHHYKSVFYDNNTEYHHQGHHEHGDENMDHVPVTFNNITNNTSTRPIVLLDENDSNFIINETLFNKLTKKFSSNQNISSRKLTKPKVLTNRIYSASSSRSTSTPPPTPIISVTKIIKNWPPNDYRIEFIEDLVQTQIGIKFLNDDENDFSQMIIMPKISSIYIVKKRGTILKVDMTSLEQLDKYTLPPSTKPISECNDSRSCHSIKEISLLSRMPDERMIWLCYVHHNPYDNHPNLQAESGCMVPTVENLAIPLVQWENPHFNSLYPDRPASVLNAADGFTYISAFTLEYLRIFRAYMPDWNGNFNWTGALVTDKSPTFIAEPAQILLTFETMNEIYFVLREQPNSPITKCGPQPENPINRLLPTEKLKLSQPTYCLTSVARLVRVCKGDPGGLPHISANRFATFAKADLICPATNKNGGYFSYTHISAAYWDNNTKLLYATFTTEKSAPTGSALCVYGLNEFKASFSGPLLRTNAIQNNMRSSPVPNSFSNICSRFNSKNKTDEEVTVGRRLSLRFPFRYLPVKPLHGHALLAQTGDIWLHLQAYNLPGLTSHYQQPEQVTTSIIWIGTKKRIIQFALYTHNDVKTSSMGKTYSTNDQDKPTTTIICKLKEIYLGRQIESFIYRIPSEEINSNRNENDAKRIRGMNLRPVHSSEETFKDSEGIFEREDKEIQHIEITASNLYIMTNRQLFRLPVTRCFEYKTFSECLQSKDPHCGWNWPEGRCSSGYLFDSTIQINRLSTFSPSVDHRQHSHHNQCPSESYTMNKNKDNSWTPWYDCSWINSQQIIDQIPITIDDHNDIDMNDNITDYIEMNQLGNCQCRVCISRTHCIFGMQQVKNCTRYDENWLPWSTWSSCDLINNIQVRQRQCRPNAICSGITMEQRSCLDDAVWFKQSNSIPKSAGYINPRVSFTGQTDGFTLTHLILVAICGLLTGSLLTIILFWICRRHRLSFNENAVIQSSSSKNT
ncbi:unnamed protein product [Heterobilharzia americana]|nr:unnamed protein product [Heterobilharzia americana]